MNRGMVVRLVLIAATAIALTYMLFLYFSKGETLVTVYMPIENIGERELITADKIRSVEVGFDEAMTFFSDYETEMSAIVGKITTEALSSEYVFRKNDTHIIQSEEEKSVKNGAINDPYFIDENQRLMKINLTEVNAVGDKVKKGDFVDVVYTSKGEATGGTYSSVILQHVFVYEAKTNGEMREIYLKMPSEECVALTLAKNTGDITLLLNPLMGGTTELKVITPDVFK